MQLENSALGGRLGVIYEPIKHLSSWYKIERRQ